MDHDIRVLKVYAFAEQVCRQKEIDALRARRRLDTQCPGRKPGKRLRASEPSSGYDSASRSKHCDSAAGRQSAEKHRHSLRILRERDYRRVRMRIPDFQDNAGSLAVEHVS